MTLLATIYVTMGLNVCAMLESNGIVLMQITQLGALAKFYLHRETSAFSPHKVDLPLFLPLPSKKVYSKTSVVNLPVL